MDGKTVTPYQLKTFILKILDRIGCKGPQTNIIAENMVWCDRIGRSNHGVRRLPVLSKRISLGLIRCPCNPQLEKKGPGVELMDGDHGSGYFTGHLAISHAIELAKDSGIGAVGVYNSEFFATGAYYVNLAAKSGMVSFAMSNSVPNVAAFGGVKPVLGTNPFAFGAPRKDGHPLMLDMATSASAGSTVRQYANEGRSLPKGIAIDSTGNPITDPNLVTQGAVLPFGGAKGFGLSLMVEILSGVLTGAGFSHGVKSMFQNFDEYANNGHMFIAIDVEHFMPLDYFYDRMEEMVTLIKASANGFPDRNVRMPGDLRWDSYAKSCDSGICLDVDNVKAIEELASAHQLEPPWRL